MARRVRIRYCRKCGVPNSIHGEACNWENARLIIKPENIQERDWQQRVLNTKPILISYPKKLSI